MKEKVFVVEGWEGDIHIFHKEENAMDYFNCQITDDYNFGDDDCELWVNTKYYLQYTHYDEEHQDYSFLTFMVLSFSD
jgi:hypothetical protein